MHSESPEHGFTLIEFLAVIAIIAILAALLFPVFTRIQRASMSVNTLSNLKQVGHAAYRYAEDREGQYFGNAKDFPKLWIVEFWPYIYPDTKFPFPNFSAIDSGSLFKGTVFYTPLIENKPVYGGQPRSFAYNYPIEQKFGTNLRYNVLIPNSSEVAILGDTRTSGSWTPAQVNARYKDSVHVTFLDQHVELVPVAKIPKATTDPFWSGSTQ